MSRSRHTPAGITGHWIRPSTRWAIYFRDGFTCVYCETVGRPTLDHVHSVERRGRDNAATNLVTACLSCNSRKKALSTRAWFARLRLEGVDVRAVRRRIARAVRRPIDRDVGRFLAEVAARRAAKRAPSADEGLGARASRGPPASVICEDALGLGGEPALPRKPPKAAE